VTRARRAGVFIGLVVLVLCKSHEAHVPACQLDSLCAIGTPVAELVVRLAFGG
jgi:hypothetical protein